MFFNLRTLKFLILIFFLGVFIFPQSVKAVDFKSDYKAEYYLINNQKGITASVKFKTSLTNFRSDVYVKKFTMVFPKSFEIKNIKANDDTGPINPEITSDGSNINIQLEFNDPAVGKESVNNIDLEFEQENLFKVNGNVWEVILPVIEDKTGGNYQIVVHLPENEDRKISIAKPKPDEIKGSTIIWNNPKAKTVYAVFGDRQYYQSKLTYNLRNTRITPVYTDVAFPPDTLYQKVYINNIDPAPSYVFMDEDGNYMGRYYLNPRQNLNILFDGVIELFNQPRSEVQNVTQERFKSQKKYLLTQKNFWDLGGQFNPGLGKTPREIYDFTVNKLSYNYQGLNSKLKRLGAAQALQTPDKAVCVEFSDVFIAFAREKGIYSREIQGFGFSNDPRLRPLSLTSDVLHSWPEYYDENSGLWIPVDPTWENTSGIDYFSSLDLNHIAFVIHGKTPDYPYPAGSYKTEDTKDVSITTIASKPEEKTKINLESLKLPTQIADTKNYETKVVIKNNSNVFLYDVPVEFKSDNLFISPDRITVSSLAPFEKKEVLLKYKSLIKNKKANADISISVMENEIYSGTIVIVPYYYEWGIFVGYAVIGFSLLILVLKLVFRKRRFQHSP